MRDLARRMHAAAPLGPLPFSAYHGLAVATLQGLWDFTAQYCPDGRVSRYSNEAIAEACFWPNDKASDLMQILIDSRWVDKSGENALIHDWPAHCEDSVHMKLARAHEFFADGTMPKLSRLSDKEKVVIKRAYNKRKPSASVRTRNAPPLPKPLPKPLVNNTPPVGGGEDESCQLQNQNQFALTADESEKKPPAKPAKALESTGTTAAKTAARVPSRKITSLATTAAAEAGPGTASATGRNAWSDWVDAHRELGRPDPTPIGQNTKASGAIGKVIANPAERLQIFLAFLRDRDPFLTKQAHALHLLTSRLDAYRNRAPPKLNTAQIYEQIEQQKAWAQHGDQT